MAARNTPKLADLLRKFEEAQQKTAGEPVPTSGDAVPQAAPVTEPASTAPTAEKVAAAEQTKEAENQTKEAENQAGDAAGQVVDAKEALKAVTDEFVNEHTAALKKEAQIFGELFAASCMEQMNKVAALQQVEQNAYATTVDALSAVNKAELMNKTAAIYDEAYFTTLAKFAGLESPEELQSILAGSPESLPPEVLNAALAASGDAPEAGGDVVTGPEAGNAEAGEALTEDVPDEPEAPGQNTVVDALTEAASAASTNAKAIKSIAEAADALAAEGNYDEGDHDGEGDYAGEGAYMPDAGVIDAATALGLPAEAPIADSYIDEAGNVDLPKIAGQAYDNVMAYMANGVR